MSQISIPFVSERQNTSWKPSEPPSLEGINEVCLDTETNGLMWQKGDLPIGISIRLPNGRCQYLPWGHSGGNLDEETVHRWARKELRFKHIIGMNTRFDIHMLYQWGVDLEAQGCTVSDVSHYAALLDDHRKGNSLEAISQDYLGYGKIQGLDGSQMALYHAADVAAYAEQDVRLVGELTKKMWPVLESQDLLRVIQLENDVIFPVCEMERNAACLDMPLLAKWLKEADEAYLECLWSIHRESGWKIEPTKSSDMARLFYALGIKVIHFTDNGSPSFTDDILKKIDHPVVQLARRARKLASLKSKYLVPYNKLATDGKLHFNLHQMRGDWEGGSGGTITGRFSSSDVNIQQVMRPDKHKDSFGEEFMIRELFIPQSGLFLSADAAQIEYRLFAHFAESPQILAAYAKDPKTDFHNIVMEMVKTVKSDITRKRTKDLNFAFIYGAGKNKISLMLGIPNTESDQLVDIYMERFPEAKQLLRRKSRAAETDGFVTTLLGRRSRFPDRSRMHKALNSVIQGSAADINKIKLVELFQERKRLGLKMRFTVHDEVCGDVPDEEAAKMVDEVLNRQSLDLNVPILWETGYGKNWKEAK